MKMQYRYWLLRILLFVASISQIVYSKTNSQDDSALNVMFKSLNSPSKLSGWQSDGGDPCDDSWEGISCKGSAVTEIQLSDYGLNGELGYQLASLKSVTTFDMSKNNLKGNMPYQLPPNLVYLDLSGNSFSGNVPYSISEMKNLKELDLSQNKLNGQLSDMFSKLPDLTTMDLSSNGLTGNLPQSFGNLSSLTNLYLQDNQFTGSINPVRDLPLTELNVKNNKFTGWIPNELKGINSLETEGNSWSTGKAPPPPPGVHHRHGAAAKHKEHGVSIKKGLMIGAACVGALVVIAILIIIISWRKASTATQYFDDERDGGKPFSSYQKDSKSGEYAAVDVKPLQKAPSKGLIASISSRMSFRDSEFANRLQEKRSTSIRTVPYALADLQNATSNFAGNRLLGEGSIGCVYKAKYGDGKVLAVKRINPSLLHGSPPEEITGVVASISKLHHPNIADLVGYCSEKENVMLVYNHFRNGSLHEFLHMNNDFSKPLTWNTRIRIGLGTARAIEYLHEVCSPPLLHKNIKSSNILLDLDLNPHLSDHGLAKFHQRTSQNLGAGYNAPECSKPSAYTLKSDVYSFGVVMLELLTGRKPLDSKRPKREECLVQWATPQLHDAAALETMADPALRGLYPPKSLSRFADIISHCVQVEPELRPPMSEVVQSLERLVREANMEMKEDLSASSRTEDFDTYYRV